MKPAGISIQKKKDVDNSIMEDVAAMKITLLAKKLVLDDAKENNHHLHQHHNNHHVAVTMLNHSDRNIVNWSPTQDHAEPFNQDIITIAKPVFAMYSDMAAVVAIQITSNRPKNVKIDVEIHKIYAHCHLFMDDVKKMLHVITMMVHAMIVFHLNTADAVETKITSILLENVKHNVNADDQTNNDQILIQLVIVMKNK